MTSKGKGPKQKAEPRPPDDSKTNGKQVPEDSEQSKQDIFEQFERELHWCIDQLELGLETQNPDSKRGQEAVKVLKILTSTKAPLIKKRQAMRNTFGDYRKKMEEEEKKSSAIAKKIKLTSMDVTGMQKSKFLRKSSSKTHHKPSESGDSSNMDTDIGDRFQFNFSLSDKSDTEEVAISSENTVTNQLISKIKGTDDISGAASSGSRPFTFVKSDNDFKFGFTVSDDT